MPRYDRTHCSNCKIETSFSVYRIIDYNPQRVEEICFQGNMGIKWNQVQKLVKVHGADVSNLASEVKGGASGIHIRAVFIPSPN